MPIARDAPAAAARKTPPVVSVRSLVARFALAGLTALAAVTAFTGYASARVGTDQAIAEAKRVTWVSSIGVITPVADDGLLTMQHESLDRMDAAVRKGVLRGALVRVKIWNQAGTVLYSDEPRLIGKTFELDAGKKAAFGSTVVTAKASSLGEPENRYETEKRLFEVYVGTSTPNGTPILFETYYSYAGVTAVGRNLWARFAPIAIGSLVLLELVQIPFAWSMARRLRHSQLERERLLQHALDASDAERRRIASDLHDGVVQDLTGVSLTLAALGRGPSVPSQQVLDASDSLRASVRGLRSLLVEIYPPNLHEEGLESAINDLLNGIATRGISTRFDAQLADARLDASTSSMIYRTAQEALRNVVSHASAHQVRAQLTASDEHVTMTIDDDGRGFSADELQRQTADGHVGVRGLSDLAADLGGSLSILSQPGTGTRVSLTMPLAARLHT